VQVLGRDAESGVREADPVEREVLAKGRGARLKKGTNEPTAYVGHGENITV
jgi:hypothetical protein